MKKSFKSAKGFTLAEVLITLGIIGVVAAMTIPSLMTKINDKVNSNRMSVIEKRLLEGINMLNTQDNGLSVQYNTTEDFVKALSKHLKMTQICSKTELTKCLPYEDIYYESNGKLESVKVADLTTAKKLQIKASGFDDTAGFIMGDGTPFILTYNKECTSADPDRPFKDIPDCVAAIYDINGGQKPNKFGSKIVNGREVGVADIKSINGARIGKSCALDFEYGNNKSLCVTTTAQLPTPATQEDCDQYKSAVGLTYCNEMASAMSDGYDGYDGYNGDLPDYYAGAVISCYKQGGRLPSDDELTEIAKQLYNDNTLTTEEKSNLTWNPTVLASLGIEDPWFTLWSSSEYDALSTYGRYFGSTYVSRGINSRHFDHIRFVCVEK